LFHPALFGRHGPGKGAFFVSEQFGFKQGMGNRGTTYLNQRAAGALGESVEQANANLFACTAFSLDKNRDISLCYSFQLIADGLHGCRSPKNNVEGRQIESSDGFSMVNQDYFSYRGAESTMMQCQ
jgi:hypothetical protein